MSPELSESDGHGFRRFAVVYAVVSGVLLAYIVAAWRGWFGLAPLSNPRMSLSLASFLAFLGMTWVSLHRSQRWGNVFGGAAVVAFVLFVAAIMAG